MSTKMLDLAWNVSDVSLAQKMVLIALADQANDRGESYPGIESLRLRCSMGLRTIYDAITALEAKDYLSRRQLPGKKTLYCLNLHRLRQQDLLQPQSPKRDAAGARCGSRRGAGAAGVQDAQDCGKPQTGGAGAALHKSNQEQKQPQVVDARAGDADPVRKRYAEYEALPDFERRECVDPFLQQLPLSIQLPVWVRFVKHRRALRKPLTAGSYLLLLQDLKALAADGVDLNQSLDLTVKASQALPIDPRKGGNGRGRGPPKPRANDDFSAASYEGTPDDELPFELDDN